VVEDFFFIYKSPEQSHSRILFLSLYLSTRAVFFPADPYIQRIQIPAELISDSGNPEPVFQLKL
jgi:hypothetical protein